MTSHRFKTGVQYWKRRTDLKYTPASLEQSALEYFEWVNENPLIEHRPMSAGGEIHMIEVPKPRPMTIKGFCLFTGISQRYLNELAHHQDFKDVIDWIKEAIYTNKFEGAAVGLFNANLISRDIGLADKQEVSSVIEQPRTLEDFYRECGRHDDGKISDSDLIDKALDSLY